MSKKNKDKNNNQQQAPQEPEVDNQQAAAAQPEEQQEEEIKEPTPEERIAQLEAQLEKEKSQYLYLMADFENFRKRTIREKADLLKYGAEGAMRNLLPVIDDLERAIAALDKSDDINALKEGVNLIYSKFVKYLESNKVVPIDSTGKDFDDNLHEAITTFPAPDESLRGKVIDTTTKGYMIDDKVLRHAKVVVGQ
ncbi:MAG: nucleotide exchange factor GrpE [Muribaculaceae bacterium]|nr:nucleotide exchange factor GrpE [Muribaculaceae bacterium]